MSGSSAPGLPPLPSLGRTPSAFAAQTQRGRATVAYAQPIEQALKSQNRIWKVWLVCGDCALIGLQPVLVHLSKNAQGRFSFNPVSISFLVEVVKTTFAIIMLIVYSRRKAGLPVFASLRIFLQQCSHNRLLAVPAGLYSVNNYLKFAMQLYFKPTTAKMLSNLKILVIALLMRFILKRHFTIWQWEALLLLMAGITVNQLSSCGASNSLAGNALIAASLYTLGSITIPSLASVYNEMALKRNMDTSVHIQNFYLYFFGVLFNLVGLALTVVLGHQSLPQLFQGHSKVTVLLVVNNALQGILSSFFFKYADTILKKYSSTMATIFTGLMSALLFGHALTINFCIGVTIVFISMHIFFSQGSMAKAAVQASRVEPTGLRLTTSPSMDHFSLRSDSVDSLASMDVMHETDNLLPRRPVTVLPL
ncbi:hypothetical protein ABBQ32_011251 [Trebouxia sp. C0010 RCD-2024]